MQFYALPAVLEQEHSALQIVFVHLVHLHIKFQTSSYVLDQHKTVWDRQQQQ